MKNLLFTLLFIPIAVVAQVGIDQESSTGELQPTEDIHVNGTTRINELPTNGTTNAIYTKADGSASINKDQTFKATKTVVADENGVLGTVDGLPIAALPEVKSIQYAFNNVPINANTPTASVITLDNLSVRFNGTNPNGNQQSLSFRLNNDIVDKVIVNQLRITNNSKAGGADNFPKAAANTWYEITTQKPDVSNNEFIQYNISLLKTREVYRLSVSVNKNVVESSPNIVASEAQVTLFMEKLSN